MPRNASQLGTFLGVYVPTLSTILGVVIFLRLTQILGGLGLYGTVGVFAGGFTVALLTTLSICALISVGGGKTADGGGLYSAIYSATNRHFASVAGCLIFIAYVCGIAFYCLGFGQATKLTIVGGQNFTAINVFSWNSAGSWIVVTISAAAALVIAVFVFLVGAFRSVMVTVGILIVIVICIVTAWGLTLADPTDLFNATTQKGHTGWSMDTLSGNLWLPPDAYSFPYAFAALFPSFTGVIAGANLSGELKDPVAAITRGTIFALITAFMLYLAESLIAAGSIPNVTLQNPNDTGIFQAIVDKTVSFPIAYIGILSTTLSSALSYMLGAPRLLEAMSRDGLLPKIFGMRYGRAREPAFALLVTTILVLATVLTGALELLAPLVTATFLLTFCVINVVCMSMTCSSTASSKEIKFKSVFPLSADLQFVSSFPWWSLSI